MTFIKHFEHNALVKFQYTCICQLICNVVICLGCFNLIFNFRYFSTCLPQLKSYGATQKCPIRKHYFFFYQLAEWRQTCDISDLNFRCLLFVICDTNKCVFSQRKMAFTKGTSYAGMIKDLIDIYLLT